MQRIIKPVYLAMKRNSSLILAIAAVTLFTSAPAHAAAVDYFLKIDGIDGESIDNTHRGEIIIESFSWGMSNAGTFAGGGGGGAGKVSMQDIHFTRRLDKASPLLMLACATGQHIPTAKLTCRKTGGDGSQVEYYTITLTNVLVSSVSTGGSSSDPLPTESISLNFTKIEWVYVPVGADGKPGEPVRAEYDLETATTQ
jgi:type VI secretion system secreted protein Hcp